MARGQRRFNFVWYRPAEAEGLRDLLTDTDGVAHPLSIPPQQDPAGGDRAPSATMRDRLLSPQFAEVVERTAAALHPGDPGSRRRRAWCSGGATVILGDAAFVARPHVGMGVTKAAADAQALAQALSASPDDLAGALARFEAERLPYGAAVIRRARELGAYMQAQILTARGARPGRTAPPAGGRHGRNRRGHRHRRLNRR